MTLRKCLYIYSKPLNSAFTALGFQLAHKRSESAYSEDSTCKSRQVSLKDNILLVLHENVGRLPERDPMAAQMYEVLPYGLLDGMGGRGTMPGSTSLSTSLSPPMQRGIQQGAASVIMIIILGCMVIVSSAIAASQAAKLEVNI